MVTKVGLQGDFVSALKDLVELDLDAIEAYDAAINRLDNISYRTQLENFKSDHVRHVKELTEVLQKHGEKAPTTPSAGKQWLTKGKVVLANLLGDEAILKAMHSNEMDTNTAYERVNEHSDKWPDATDILAHGLADEKRHKAWLESVLESVT